jgi:hypothetical protein
MSDHGSSGRQAAPEETAPPFDTLVLLCSKCEGARRGPNSSEARKHLKKELGKPRQLRVLEVECLKLCPDHGLAACVVDVSPAGVSMKVLRSSDELDALTTELARRVRAG